MEELMHPEWSVDKIEKLKITIDEKEKIYNEIFEKVDKLKATIEEVKEKVEANAESIEDINTTIAEHGNEISKIEGLTNTTIENAKNIASNKTELELLKGLIGAGGSEEGTPITGVVELLNPYICIVDNTKEMPVFLNHKFNLKN